MLGTEKIFRPKVFFIQHFFGIKHFFGPKIFWTQNLFDLKIFLDPIFLWGPRFLDPKFSYSQNFLFFLPKIFLDTKRTWEWSLILSLAQLVHYVFNPSLAVVVIQTSRNVGFMAIIQLLIAESFPSQVRYFSLYSILNSFNIKIILIFSGHIPLVLLDQ